MNRLATILSFVLIGQIAMAVLLRSSDTGFGGNTDQKLLKIDIKAVNKITLEEKGKPPLSIEKNKDSWQLPGFDNFPASNEAVSKLLDSLKDLNRGWPVASTQEAATRYKVAPDDYVEKLTLSIGASPLATIFIGSSSGYHKVYVRLNNESDVESCELPSQQLSANTDDWFDRSAAAVKQDELAAVELPQFKLENKDKDWILIQPDGKAVKLDALVAGQMLDEITSINISSVLGQQEKAEYGLASPAYSFSVKLKNGTRVVYKFGKLKDGKFLALKSSNFNYFVTVDPWLVDRLKEASASSLIEKSEQLSKAKEKGLNMRSGVNK